MPEKYDRVPRRTGKQKKTHKSLAKNILNINKKIRPHLHIVDGLISMEGLGPTRGTPCAQDLSS